MFDAADRLLQLPTSDLDRCCAWHRPHGERKAPRVGAKPVLAVDILDGVDGSPVRAGRGVPPADCTVTFAALKLQLLLGAGRILAGDVEVVDIGLDTRRGPGPARCRGRGRRLVVRPRPLTAHSDPLCGLPPAAWKVMPPTSHRRRRGKPRWMVSLSTPGTDGSAPEEVVRRCN